ncbi:MULTISPECIES: cadherin-like beta sandwich domain-containing protein [unclassified Parabacteroides]|uniref:cadherin-like beta sandwich domain-containing protein n=1 Tax=unclassified Parabacteroides TaxID=2649774 RepID=UPI0024769232|nr:MULTISPECIES: cadherin-like beta sandwich domain-containing protein [unclassified Parabacteroides]
MSKDVEVAAEGVAPANMTISSTGYEFTGGAISSSGILSVNENTTFKNQFNSTGGVTIADGKTLTLNNTADQMLSSVLSGNGAITKNGTGTLTLSGNSENFGGTFIQNAGTIHLATKASLGGTFTQNVGALTSESGAALNTANFKGTVTPIGTLNVDTASFNGATLDLSGDLRTNKISATGKVTFAAGANETTIKLGDLSSASSDTYYILMQGSQISGLDQINIDVTLGGIRGGLYLADEDKTLIFGLITGNTTLTWTGIGATLWNTTETNTNWYTDNFRTYFKNGDNVVFNNIAVSKDVEVAAEGVEPANMTISSTGYEFTGGAISSSDILSVNENTTFNNPFHSTGGVTIANGKTLIASDLDLAGSLDIKTGGTCSISGNATLADGSTIAIDLTGTSAANPALTVGGTFDIGTLGTEKFNLNIIFSGTLPTGTYTLINGGTFDFTGRATANLPAGAYFKTDILGKLMLVVPPSSDATLLSLTLSESGLSPEFNATITEYSLSVGNDVQIITILATANSEKAEVGGDTGTWTLDIGENVFKVIVTAENGAIETYTITIIRADNTVGIVDVGAAEDVSVYPNPTKGIVYIKTKNGVIPEVSVFSSTGNQLMFKQKCTQIDLTSFTKGLYILLIDEKPVKVIRK